MNILIKNSLAKKLLRLSQLDHKLIFFSTTSVEIKDESEDTKVVQEPKISKKSNSKDFSSSQELFGFDEAMLITAKEDEEYSFGLPLKENMFLIVLLLEMLTKLLEQQLCRYR
ncbi:putative replication initiator [Francisella tularensis]|nr:putative replication initiator [Francisella tularensis]